MSSGLWISVVMTVMEGIGRMRLEVGVVGGPVDENGNWGIPKAKTFLLMIGKFPFCHFFNGNMI